MPTPANSATALVPQLPDVANRRRLHSITDLEPGDQLHLTAPVLGFKRGRVLPIYGYCALTDERNQVFEVRAYVRADDARAHAVAFSQREARRYPAVGQCERWFGGVLMYLVEIDLTDYADCLCLERLSERVLPLLAHAEANYSHSLAA